MAATIRATFAITILLASALMFVVEPMFARMILPRLGGTPAVWNTCLVFFQAALLGGYIYAHLLAKWASLRQQVVAHAVLVVLAASLLPVAVAQDWLPPVDRSPIPWLLLALTVGVGGPFLILSATSPLLQHWYSQTDHQGAHDPYHLYAASNLGSIIALLGYPFAIEPTLSLSAQTAAWTFAYWMFAALAIGCAAFATRWPMAVARTAVADAPRTAQAVSWRTRIRWLVLALVPSSLLLSVTTYLSMDVAAVPLLWTVPLTLYLLSFVLAFARRPVISLHVARRLLPVALTPLVLVMVTVPGVVLLLLFPLHLLAFFLCALTLHSGLANSRPAPRHLTEFYLWIGLGGVIGGLLNTLIAPLMFTNITEYPLGLVAACLIQPWADSAGSRRVTRNDVLFGAVLALSHRRGGERGPRSLEAPRGSSA